MTKDVIDLVREELRFDLRSALHRAFEQGEETLSVPIVMRLEGVTRRIYLQVKPAKQDEQSARFALIFFIEGETLENRPVDHGEHAGERPADEVVRQLQEELQLTQVRLHTVREESEAGNEELRAANEELHSINEEYRSTSEELETSKEELQSLNEELQAVNLELKQKLDTISRAHSDLQNLMAATDFGTLFLDTSLRIKRFTPRLTDLFNVTPSDEGRPITDFTHALDFDDMADQARLVLRDLVPIEQEIPDRKSNWYLVRMRTYRTVDDKIDGVVATFVNITERRRIEEALRNSEERLRQQMRLVELSRSPIFVWDFDGGILEWNRGSEELYGYKREEVLGRKKEDFLRPIVPGSSFQQLRRELLDNGSWSGQIKHHAKNGAELTVDSQIELMNTGDRRLVLESTRDVTDWLRWEARLKLVLGELSHRVKNTLTVVQSMARQTLRTSATGEAFVERFEGRLDALANAHKLLFDSDWHGAELGTLIKTQLQAHALGDGKRIRVEGQTVMLPPELATPFGLVIHELATNAIKYGALSNNSGTISISWLTESGNDHPRLRFEWREQGGPLVSAPKRSGFGTLLIDRGLPEAIVTHEYLAEGLVCKIDVPLHELRDNEHQAIRSVR